MIRAADVLAEGRRVPDFAGSSTVTPDWAPVHARIRDEATADWDDQVAVDRLVDAGAHVRARHRDARPARAPSRSTGTTYAARKGVVLNTGTEPVGAAHRRARRHAVLDQPRRRAARRAARVADRHRRRRHRRRAGAGVLPVRRPGDRARGGASGSWAREEPEASALVADVFGREGIQVLTGATISSVAYAEGQFTVEVGERDAARRQAARRGRPAPQPRRTSAWTPWASTRRPARVEVTAAMRAGDGLWAIGDITGKGAFTHMSMYQAAIAVRDILGQDGPEAVVPRGAARDLHRSRGRLGRDDRAAGPRRRAHRAGRHDGPRLVHARLDRQGPRG